jgi:CTP:molybdopterin cytidylyltransferase MocA
VSDIRGLLLAAGSGSRMGGPKALLRDPSSGSTYVEQAIGVLREGGCDGVTVVVGASAAQVRDVLGRLGGEVEVVECPDWAEGMGASLRAGLTALADTHADAALVTLVDLPDVGPAVVQRLLAHEQDRTRLTCSRNGPVHGARAVTAALSRAAYDGVPGHPALIGRAHWEGVVAVARGDRGARDYYATHPHTLVECGDLATGTDVDSPHDLNPPT